VALDTHPYFAFRGSNEPLASFIPKPCAEWAPGVNTTQRQFGLYIVGEFSAAINDCGLYIEGIPDTHTVSLRRSHRALADLVSPFQYGGDCSQWDNWQSWDQTTKANLKELVLTSMDSLQNWFYWTWRIGKSLQTGTVRAPFWSYQLGLENGWIPTDPREAIGKCASIGQAMNQPFDGVYQPWQTGGDPAAKPTATYDWPPTTLGNINPASWLPTYTPTAPIITLAGPVVTSGVDGGSGWYNSQDTAGMMTAIAGCAYPNAYSAATLAAPTGPVCGPNVVPLPTGVAGGASTTATTRRSRTTTSDTAAIETDV
jgi:glucan 1,3-beta-glucosidase